MIRTPAVAGQFYPGKAAEVATELDQFIQPVANRRRAKAVVVPHAGWMYSGTTAGLAYSHVVVPDHVILVGPNHRNVGTTYAVFAAGEWQTPLGPVPIAAPLATALLNQCDLLDSDTCAHTREHSLEVQVPMLLRANPHVQILPLLIGGGWPEAGGRSELRQIGEAIAKLVAESKHPVLLVASTDLNHYENQETSHLKDKAVLDAIVALDEEALMQQVMEKKISMCGIAPTYLVLVAAKQLGATTAKLLDYRTSGDVSGDYHRVVGYGAVLIE